MSTPAESPTPPSVKEGGVGAGAETTIKPGAKISNEWELDVYSRPVVGADGKKLWELLICDSTGNFRHVSPIPSNMVNSREVRRTIEGVIEAAPGGSKPTVIRFFRNAMFNMIDIALKEVEVAVKPCRTTYAMYQWLEERERDVYPAMAGFKPTMKQPAFFDIRVRCCCCCMFRVRACGYDLGYSITVVLRSLAPLVVNTSLLKSFLLSLSCSFLPHWVATCRFVKHARLRIANLAAEYSALLMTTQRVHLPTLPTSVLEHFCLHSPGHHKGPRDIVCTNRARGCWRETCLGSSLSSVTRKIEK